MIEQTGPELEEIGKRSLEQLGLICCNPLNHVRLLDLNPSGQHSQSENCEFDYAIPVDRYALIGEMSGRADEAKTRRKYKKFREAFSALVAEPTRNLWSLLGIRDKDLHLFRNVSEIRGFFITSKLTKFDVDLTQTSHLAIFYRNDWDTLADYAATIGRFAKNSFLHNLGVDTGSGYRPVKPVVSVIKNKKIVSGPSPTASLYTFEVSPYELLDISRVHRRDALPELVAPDFARYQRPLLREKLLAIRKDLLQDRDFILPNPILAVLSADCHFDEAGKKLELPQRYGAISIIDGQHRLYSYADERLHADIGSRARIMVTAVQFDNQADEVIAQLSARTFVEINTNQTKILATHRDSILYSSLRDEKPRAIAAEVLLRANMRKGPLYGLFQTTQTALGIVPTTTVVGALRSLLNLEAIESLRSAQRGPKLRRLRGYEALFNGPIVELCEAESLIVHATSTIDRYFKEIACTFELDWPVDRQRRGTCFENAKFIAAWIRLLKTFVWEGAQWTDVAISLQAIRGNVLKLNRQSSYTKALFALDNPRVPTADYKEGSAHQFLVANRQKATSVRTIAATRRHRP